MLDNSGNYRERLNVVIFKLWRWSRPLLKWTSNEWLGRALILAGIAIAVAAFTVRGLEEPTLLVAGLGFLPGFGYGVDRTVSRFLRRRAPIAPDSKIHPRDFLHAPIALDSGYRLARPTDANIGQLYPYVDLSHHDDFIHSENDISRVERIALYQRWYNFSPDAFMHLEKMVNGAWRPISISIVLPLSSEGYKKITAAGASERNISVIDLDQHGILRRPWVKYPVLLIDTWVVDRPGKFGGSGHGKTDERGGNANLLVLRHIAQFWNSHNKFGPMQILIETANPPLVAMLKSLSFQPSGASKIGETFYRIDKLQFDQLARPEFKQIKEAVRSIENVPVVDGTAERPKGWYYR